MSQQEYKSNDYSQRCGAKMQEAADDLGSLYKRDSLDDDLDDALRSELLSQLSAGSNPLSTMVFKPRIHMYMNHFGTC